VSICNTQVWQDPIMRHILENVAGVFSEHLVLARKKGHLCRYSAGFRVERRVNRQAVMARKRLLEFLQLQKAFLSTKLVEAVALHLTFASLAGEFSFNPLNPELNPIC
jgi:hypothetical protein